ncbi:MAG TPA: hypothetical protein VFT74_17915, partial [Isosphaeraceae bacterium]|nr:hypothetical protein [Isosphaeraceae bacterium]
MTDFKKGDRVKVSAFEGVVRAADSGGVDVESEDGKFLAWVEDVKRIQIEKIEPPVEAFKPGDTVRALGLSDMYFSLGQDGY